jgi:hypothetical protein
MNHDVEERRKAAEKGYKQRLDDLKTRYKKSDKEYDKHVEKIRKEYEEEMRRLGVILTGLEDNLNADNPNPNKRSRNLFSAFMKAIGH